MNDDDFVRAIRIPRELYEKIRAWADAQTPPHTIQNGIRHVLVRGMKDIERSRK